MEKTYKRVPFDIELAKKIQSGEIEGRIVTDNGYAVRIICFDKKTSSGYPILGLVDYPKQSEMCKAFNKLGLCYDRPVKYVLQIELPEEAPITFHTDMPKGYVEYRGDVICFVQGEETPKHEFKPFDKVLVRSEENQAWRCDIFSHMSLYNHEEFRCISNVWKQCIPYNEETAHLVGTTDNPK